MGLLTVAAAAHVARKCLMQACMSDLTSLRRHGSRAPNVVAFPDRSDWQDPAGSGFNFARMRDPSLRGDAPKTERRSSAHFYPQPVVMEEPAAVELMQIDHL